MANLRSGAPRRVSSRRLQRRGRCPPPSSRGVRSSLPRARQRRAPSTSSSPRLRTRSFSTLSTTISILCNTCCMPKSASFPPLGLAALTIAASPWATRCSRLALTRASLWSSKPRLASSVHASRFHKGGCSQWRRPQSRRVADTPSTAVAATGSSRSCVVATSTGKSVRSGSSAGLSARLPSAVTGGGFSPAPPPVISICSTPCRWRCSPTPTPQTPRRRCSRVTYDPSRASHSGSLVRRSLLARRTARFESGNFRTTRSSLTWWCVVAPAEATRKSCSLCAFPLVWGRSSRDGVTAQSARTPRAMDPSCGRFLGHTAGQSALFRSRRSTSSAEAGTARCVCGGMRRPMRWWATLTSTAPASRGSASTACART
mmetsp:Transcript_66527/g.148495  ORF Transcript_66527/g.148495 Transcript_66527/m.148495 type:complete len:373 (+) Transcript_66527:255-1373(+)